MDSYLVLLQSGVYTAAIVTNYAVGSYPTISPLPISWRYNFCCTCRELTLPRNYLALYSMKSGLSSNKLLAVIRSTRVHFNTFYIYLEMPKRNLYTSCLEKEVTLAISFDASVGDKYSRNGRQKFSSKFKALLENERG